MGTADCALLLGLQISSHLAPEHLDCAGTEHPERVAFVPGVTEILVENYARNGIGGLRQHEYVGDEITGAACLRLIVTSRARVRLGRRHAGIARTQYGIRRARGPGTSGCGTTPPIACVEIGYEGLLAKG